jgi:Zn-dependent protease with chaperone function
MASYVALTPPESAAPDDETVLIRDGFAWLALIVPLLWLLWHRLWFAALMLFLLSIAIAVAMGQLPGASPVLTVASVLVSLFVALEGNGWRIDKKERQGWTFRTVIEADNRATAEEIWIAGVVAEQAIKARTPPPALTKTSARHPATGGSGPALGLIDYGDRG